MTKIVFVFTIFECVTCNTFWVFVCDNFHAFNYTWNALNISKIRLWTDSQLNQGNIILLTSCSNIAYSPSVFCRTIAILTSFCRDGTFANDWHSNTFTNKSNSFRKATLREMVSVASLLVSILPDCFEYRNWLLIEYEKHWITHRFYKPLMATPFRLIDVIA